MVDEHMRKHSTLLVIAKWTASESPLYTYQIAENRSQMLLMLMSWTCTANPRMFSTFAAMQMATFTLSLLFLPCLSMYGVFLHKYINCVFVCGNILQEYKKSNYSHTQQLEWTSQIQYWGGWGTGSRHRVWFWSDNILKRSPDKRSF